MPTKPLLDEKVRPHDAIWAGHAIGRRKSLVLPRTKENFNAERPIALSLSFNRTAFPH
jgi:hypothetical protein